MTEETTAEAPTTETTEKRARAPRTHLAAALEGTEHLTAPWPDGKIKTADLRQIYDSSKHLTPKCADFVDEPTYLEFLAFDCDAQIPKLAARAGACRAEAAEIRVHGSRERMVLARRLARTEKRAAELRQQLTGGSAAQ